MSIQVVNLFTKDLWIWKGPYKGLYLVFIVIYR